MNKEEQKWLSDLLFQVAEGETPYERAFDLIKNYFEKVYMTNQARK